MTNCTPNLKKLKAWGSFATLVFTLHLLLGTAEAGEVVLKSRDVAYTVEETWIQIGEDESHGIGTYQLSGLSFGKDGQVGTTVDKGSYESNKGSATFEGYYVVTFSDGSGWMEKYDGTSKPIDEKTNAVGGTTTLVGGTGRFDGIKGEGTWSGTHHTSNGMYVYETEIKATVPD